MKHYRLIAFDMDGTLLNSNKKISPATLEAIQLASSKGKQVVLSTGRCLPELEEYFETLDTVRYMICVSGGYVLDRKENKKIYSNEIHSDMILQLLKIANKYDCMVHLLSLESIVQKKDVKNMSHFNMSVYQPMYQRVTTQVDDLLSYYKENLQDIAKINFYHHSKESRDAMYKEIRHLPLELAFAEETSLECSAKNVTKGTGLIQLCEYLNINIDETIAVGDADNDLNILSTAGLSVAMGNANENVKHIADVTVSDFNHDGCKEAIEKYLLV